MALITCAECGNQVSDKAAACPKCGAPVSTAAPLSTPATNVPPTPQAVAPATPQAYAPTVAQTAPVPGQRKPFLSAGRVVLWLFIAGGGWLAFKLTTGSSLAGAVRGPETIFSETIQLQEGNAQGYGFTLPTSRRVEVEVKASPKVISLMLMTEAQWANYQKIRGSLWGGQFQYTRELSHQNVLAWSGSAVLPAGRWRLVVERPSESLVFGDGTNATVKIIGH